MCGIAGIASTNPIIGKDQLLILMRDTMLHRGPDDAGVWWSGDHKVGLTHCRLSIIDLSFGGHQPMSDMSGQICVVFNGEIYNHASLRQELQERCHCFRTSSDTEVIIEAYREWGVDCVRHMNGMFAFCIYDNCNKRVFLARDRAGEKPLFYRCCNGELVFASELKALMADKGFAPEIDPDALNYFLAYGFIPGNRCILQGVHKLSQGEALTYNLVTHDLQKWLYWELPLQQGNPSCSGPELVDELEGLLTDSVRMRLVADVPVGILLSGGIDSSLVTAVAARISSVPVKTFTITFPGHGSYDEGPYARLVAQHFGTDHTELEAESASVNLLPVLAAQFDEPIADSSMVPTYLVSQLVRQHAIVALNGDGGDELFGGYTHYSWLLAANRCSNFIPPILSRLVGKGAARFLPTGFKGRNYLIGFHSGLIAFVDMFFDAYSRNCLLTRDMNEQCGNTMAPESYKQQLCSNRSSRLQQAMATDFMTYLVDDNLTKVDRASMLNSLEMRAPWLDHRIIEFAFSKVPDTLKATQRERKILPRLLAQRILPKELDMKRKQGFSIPLATWFKGDWGEYIISVVSEADPYLFNRRYIDKLISEQLSGYDNTKRLFALTMFELWRREYL